MSKKKKDEVVLEQSQEKVSEEVAIDGGAEKQSKKIVKENESEKITNKLVLYKDIKLSKEVNAYLNVGNASVGALGLTDHSSEHALVVAKVSGDILKELKYDKRDVELARIAGYMHDIGNCVNRHEHAYHGALLARSILKDLGMDVEEIATVINAIGIHDEKSGGAVNPISAALILADKTDVRRDRVKNKNKASFDKHDRVNYAVTYSELNIDTTKHVITFNITLDENICSIMDYFEIFLCRMLMCKKASEILGMRFKMIANGNKVC